MALGTDLIKVLSKIYAPLTMVEKKFRGYDLAFKTDADGNPILLFMGTKKQDGSIKGNRYARRLIKDKEGNVIKDHWDDKGKTD